MYIYWAILHILHTTLCCTCCILHYNIHTFCFTLHILHYTVRTVYCTLLVRFWLTVCHIDCITPQSQGSQWAFNVSPWPFNILYTLPFNNRSLSIKAQNEHFCLAYDWKSVNWVQRVLPADLHSRDFSEELKKRKKQKKDNRKCLQSNPRQCISTLNQPPCSRPGDRWEWNCLSDVP